jgi:hypothetical protein
VLLTSIVNDAVWLLPPVTVRTQWPTATGVTVNDGLVPLAVAMPLHDGEPLVTVNVPL